MKYRVAIFFSILISIVCCQGFAPVSAHVIKSDDSIKAELHINPADNPKSKTATEYVLWFDDTTGKLTLYNCDCIATFQENDNTIATQKLNPVSDLSSVNTVTFPTADIYTLKVAGAPKQSGEFQPFNLTYTLRVEAVTPTKNEQSFPMPLAIGLGLMVGLVLLGAYVFDSSSRKGNTRV